MTVATDLLVAAAVVAAGFDRRGLGRPPARAGSPFGRGLSSARRTGSSLRSGWDRAHGPRPRL